MMKLLCDSTVANLKSNIAKNLPRYRDGSFGYLTEDTSLFFTTTNHLELRELEGLVTPDKNGDYDAKNSWTVYSSLENISPYEATDERLWALLSHTFLLEYGRKRWSIPRDDEKAIKHIKTHFFAGTQRQLERDNVGSRLWWMGYLCNRSALPIEKALEVFLYRSDVRASVIERPTTSQSVPVFSAILTKLFESYENDEALFERKAFRGLMAFLNRLGGYRLLDAMPQSWVERQIDSYIELLSTK